MALRIYIVPMVTELVGTKFDIHPQYIYGLPYIWAAIPYGSDDVCICGVHDISTADHNSLIANSDVFGLPENLDQLMATNAVNVAQTFLENLNIPANWINTSRTYREVVKIVIGIFQFNQIWSGLTNGNTPFKEGMNLSTQYNQMSTIVKKRLRDCFDILNIDRTSLTATSSIREALILFGQEFSNSQIKLAGEIL